MLYNNSHQLFKYGISLLLKKAEDSDLKFEIQFEITRRIVIDILRLYNKLLTVLAISNHHTIYRLLDNTYSDAPQTRFNENEVISTRAFYKKYISFINHCKNDISLISDENKTIHSYLDRLRNEEFLEKLNAKIEEFNNIDIKVQEKMNELTEGPDWRPRETIPEDYYAL